MIYLITTQFSQFEDTDDYLKIDGLSMINFCSGFFTNVDMKLFDPSLTTAYDVDRTLLLM